MYNLKELREINLEGFLKKNNISKKINILNNKKYYIYNYSSDFLHKDDYSTIGLYRSVICDENNCILSFSPPKTLLYDTFLTQHSDNIQLEELVEGVMINLFWVDNDNDGSWEISTKNKVGGNNHFYYGENIKTLREMFLEATIKVLFNFEDLPKTYSYSFVLKHPNIDLTSPVIEPELYFITAYLITDTDISVISRDIVENLSCVKKSKLLTPALFSDKKDIKEYKNILHKLKNGIVPYYTYGMVLNDIDNGTRYKIINPNFNNIIELNTEDSKIYYQYLVLRKHGKVKYFLKYYPQYKKQCETYRDAIHSYTRLLHNNYVDCYIKKKIRYYDLPVNFKTHVKNLHMIYINSLMKNKKVVDFHIVKTYFNNLHQSRQFYILNHNLNLLDIDCKIMQIIKNVKDN